MEKTDLSINRLVFGKRSSSTLHSVNSLPRNLTGKAGRYVTVLCQLSYSLGETGLEPVTTGSIGEVTVSYTLSDFSS
jgi:hypothetical protein